MKRAKRTMYAFYIDSDLRKALRSVRDAEDISESEQIRRALRGWLERKGGLKKTTKRKR